MTSTPEGRLLALLEGRLDEEARLRLLDELADDPSLLAQLESASAGMLRMERLAAEAGPSGSPSLDPGSPGRPRAPRRVPAWWTAAAAAVTLLVAVPATLRWSQAGAPAPDPTPPVADVGRPAAPSPSYMLVLQGVWPDRDELGADEVRARADEYWDFVTELARDQVLVAAGDLRFEGGRRLGRGSPLSLTTADVQSPDHLVGILTLRVDSYEAALEIARRSPHLRYGGTVTVREVGLGFVAVPGMDDWAG